MKKFYFILFCIIMLTFGCSQPVPPFDGNRAFEYLEEQCDFGPRNPNSDGHLLCKNYIQSFLEDNGAKVYTQEFTAGVRGETYTLTNIIGSYYPTRPARIFIGTHWDTRPWADKDRDSLNHSLPVPGANDGASGTALLLHLAEILNKYEPPLYGVDLLFFDGEDMGEYGVLQSWSLGARYFVENYSGIKPKYVIVVDMIGDKDLDIKIEKFSYQNSPELVTKVWRTAHSLNIPYFSTKVTDPVYDDHYPFLEQGYQAVLIIDFDYLYWHTREDTPDKCSPESLEAVGQVIVNLIYKKI